MQMFGLNEANMNTFNPFRPEFTIVIFIHKPRIAVAILDL